MANLVNSTPTTIKVGEPPLTTSPYERGIFSSTWSKWFSAIGTWITRSQENKSGEFKYNDSVIGSFRINRTGNIVCLCGSINAGTYTNIIVSGVSVYPLVDVPIVISNGAGKISTNGELTMNSNSTEKILISVTYIAQSPKEIN